MKRPILTTITLLALVALLFHAPVLFGGGVRMAMDQRMFAPWKACIPAGELVPDPVHGNYNRLSSDSNFWYAGQIKQTVGQMRQGYFPAWDDKTMCGTPLGAQMGAPLWYPPLWLLLLGDPLYMIGWLGVLHMLLAGIFTWRFLRQLEATPLASLLGAIAFAIGPWMAYRANNMTILASSAWVPLALEMALRIGRGRAPFLATIGLACALAMSLISGMPQLGFVAAWGAIFMGAWAIFRTPQNRRQHLLFLALGPLLAFCLALPALLPTIRLFSQSIRAASPGLGGELALLPGALLGMLSPEVFGGAADLGGWTTFAEFPPTRAFLSGHPQDNPFENVLYTGAAILALTLITLFFRPRLRRQDKEIFVEPHFCVGMAIFALVIAMRLIPWAPLYRLPGFGPDDPRRILILFHLGLIATGAITLGRFQLKSADCTLAPNWLFLGLPLLGLGVASWLFPGLGNFFVHNIFGFLPPEQTDLLLGFEIRALLYPSLALALFGIGFFFHRRFPKLFNGILLASLTLELLAFGYRTNPAPPGAQFLSDQSSRTLTFLRELQEEAGPAGPPRLCHVKSFHSLQGNIIAAQGIPVVTATHPLPLNRFLSRMMLVEDTMLNRQLPRGLSCLEKSSSVVHPLLATAGIGLFCCDNPETHNELQAQGLHRIFPPPGQDNQAEGVAIFKSPWVNPRARLFFSWTEVEDQAKARESLQKSPQNLVIETTSALPGAALPKDEPSVTWDMARPGRIELTVDSAGGRGVLLIADCWYPGWSATCNGKQTKLYPADLAFMALPIAPGKHRVVLHYTDPDRLIGFIFLLAGLAGLAFLGWKHRQLGFVGNPQEEPG